MKILFLSHRLPWPLKDGGAIAIHTNLKGFLDAGLSVKLLCLNPIKDQAEIDQLPEFLLSAKPEAIKVNTNLSVLDAFLNLFGNESYHVTRFYNRNFEFRLLELLKSEEYDVVHMEGAFIAQYAPLIKQHSKACLVLREHNVEFAIWRGMAAKEKNPIKAAYLRLLAARLERYERNLWKQVDLISAISPDDLREFAAVNPSSFLGGVGFDLTPYLKEDQEGEKLSLFHIGSMDWLPNKEAVRWLLDDIWPLIKSELPTCKLNLAGKHMPDSWTINQDQLHIQGEVSSAIAYMAKFQIMLVPLLSGSGIRIKTIEAMAMGKVVISTELGLSGLDVVPDKEVLVANTAKEFVAAIKRLEENPALIKEIGAAARKKVIERYSLEKHMEASIEKYRNCKAQ